MQRATDQGRTLRVTGHKQVGLVTDLQRNNIHLDYINFASADSIVPALKQNMEVYEKWFVHGMKLEYIPTVAMTATGTIHIAPDYDPIDQISPSTTAMSEAFGYVGGPVSRGIVCDMPNRKEVDGSFTKSALYCSPADNDRFVSYGFFDVFVEGVTAESTVGRLILHYDVTFIKPSPYKELASDNTSITTLTMAGDNAEFTTGNNIATVTDHNECVTNVVGPLGSCFSGVINTIAAGLTLLNEYNINVIPGQRIFFKMANAYLAGASQFTTPASTAKVGAINLSRSFDPRTAIQWSAAAANKAIALRDVMNI